MATINKEACPTCGQSVNIREIGLYKGMVDALLEVFKWCEIKGRHEFDRKEIKHLLKNDGQIARFGDWVMFGGLVYKHGKGHYGLNMERCRDFFANNYEIPSKIFKNPLTQELTPADYKTIKNIPKLKDFLDENYDFISKYHDAEPKQDFNAPKQGCKWCIQMIKKNNWYPHEHN